MARLTEYDLEPTQEEIDVEKHPDGLWSGAEARKKAWRKKIALAIEEVDENELTDNEATLFAFIKSIVKNNL